MLDSSLNLQKLSHLTQSPRLSVSERVHCKQADFASAREGLRCDVCKVAVRESYKEVRVDGPRTPARALSGPSRLARLSYLSGDLDGHAGL